MNSVDITLSSGRKFTQHQPSSLNYFIGYVAKADFLIYEAGLYTPLDLAANEEVTFQINPAVGESAKFTGVLYRVESKGQNNKFRMTFVSKYYRGLMSCEPLSGKGNIADIAGNFYAKAGVPNIIKDTADVSADNLVFPPDTRTDEAVAYCLARATAANDSYLVGTVVGDSAYIRDIKKGREIRGFTYQPMKIVDNRRKVDIMGGINMHIASDAADVDTQTSTAPSGTNEVKVNKFYGIPDTVLARAYLKVQQRQLYYTSYVASVNSIGWVPLLGASILVNDEVLENKTWFQSLYPGKYFVNSQNLFMDFSGSAYPKTQLGLQLVG